MIDQLRRYRKRGNTNNFIRTKLTLSLTVSRLLVRNIEAALTAQYQIATAARGYVPHDETNFERCISGLLKLNGNGTAASEARTGEKLTEAMHQRCHSRDNHDYNTQRGRSRLLKYRAIRLAARCH